MSCVFLLLATIIWAAISALRSRFFANLPKLLPFQNSQKELHSGRAAKTIPLKTLFLQKSTFVPFYPLFWSDFTRQFAN